MHWHDNNCSQCCRYENESTEVNKAKCRLAFYLDFAAIDTGEISLCTANKIGLDENGCLKPECNYFNQPIIRKKYPKKIKGQTDLFEQAKSLLKTEE